jgi:hypothetical protein
MPSTAPVIPTGTTGGFADMFNNALSKTTDYMFPSLKTEFLDSSGEPLTGMSKVIAKGAALRKDLKDFGEAGPKHAVNVADMFSGGNLTSMVQEDILGGLNNGTPVRRFGDGSPVRAGDLFTPEGAALFRDRFNAARKRSERQKRRMQQAAGRGTQ